MNTKLTVTLALASSVLAGSAHAYDKLDLDDGGLLGGSTIDAMWSTTDGQLASDTLSSSTTITPDPSPVCANVTASKDFYKPLLSESLAGQTISVGAQGGARLVADATKLEAQASFGPGVEVLGRVYKPMDVQLSASTNNMGINSLDLRFFAFGREIDTENITNTTNPIQYVASHNWSLPAGLTGPLWSGSIGCGSFPGVKNCRIGWELRSSVVADLSAIFVLKVNSNGVEAHAMTSANSHFALTTSGTLSADVYDPISEQYEPITATATGTGVIKLGQAYFAGHGTLKPQDSHWSAILDVGYNIEDLLSAKATIGARAFGRDVRKTLFERTGQTFADTYYYNCLFDKKF